MSSIEEKKTPKPALWITGAACFLIVMALAVTGLQLVRDAAKAREPKRLAFGVKVPASEIETNGMVTSRRTAAVERAEVLRKHWFNWAKAHRAELIQMKQNKNAGKAFNEVYNTLPATPYASTSGFQLGDLNGLETDVRIDGVPASKNPVKVPQFGWCLANKLPQPPAVNAKEQAQNKKFWQDVEKGLQKDFSYYRDIRLLQSTDVGEVNISLWVSGRVTQDGWIHQDKAGQPAMIKAPAKEIIPPYDFVR